MDKRPKNEYMEKLISKISTIARFEYKNASIEIQQAVKQAHTIKNEVNLVHAVESVKANKKHKT